MDDKKRKANEAEFDSWLDKDNGGRVYYFEISGKFGWKAKYNLGETLLHAWQWEKKLRGK